MKKFLAITVLLFSAASFAQLKNVLVPYKVSNQWGFSDSNGKIMIQPVYDSVALYRNVYSGGKSINYAKVFSNKKVGLIDVTNKPLLALQYSNITNADYDDTDRFIVTDVNGKSGLVDFNKVILPVTYDKIRSIRNHSYLVEKTGKLGIVDNSGKLVIPILYNQINFVSDNEETCKWKVVNDKETKFIELPSYKDTEETMYSVAGIEEIPDFNIDSLKSRYDQIFKHRDNNYAYMVKKGNKFGFVNLRSGTTLKPGYAKLDILDGVYHEDKRYNTFVLLVTEGKSEGIIDEKGTVLVPAIYDDIHINGGNCEVKMDKLIGYYFTKTNKFFEPKYKGYTAMEHFGGSYDNPVFKIIGVYETEKKEWYYIGENGVVFKQ